MMIDRRRDGTADAPQHQQQHARDVVEPLIVPRVVRRALPIVRAHRAAEHLREPRALPLARHVVPVRRERPQRARDVVSNHDRVRMRGVRALGRAFERLRVDDGRGRDAAEERPRAAARRGGDEPARARERRERRHLGRDGGRGGGGGGVGGDARGVGAVEDVGHERARLLATTAEVVRVVVVVARRRGRRRRRGHRGRAAARGDVRRPPEERRDATTNDELQNNLMLSSIVTRTSDADARRRRARVMAEDDWSFLDEEVERLEKKSKGGGGGRRASGGGGGGRRGGGGGRAETNAADSSAPATTTTSDPLDEWSALDEELEKLTKKGGRERGGGGGGARDAPPPPPQRPAPSMPPPPPQIATTTTTTTTTTRPPPSTPHRAPPPARDAIVADALALDTPCSRREKLASRAARFADDAPPAPAPRPRRRDLDDDDDDDRGGGAPRHIVGACEDMCPVAERERRANAAELDVLERVWDATQSRGDRKKTSAQLAVKKYTRIVDDPSPADVRTRAALTRTCEHLYSLLGGRARYGDQCIPKSRWASTRPEDLPLLARSDFLWDRLRGVRQDMSLQGFNRCVRVSSHWFPYDPVRVVNAVSEGLSLAAYTCFSPPTTPRFQSRRASTPFDSSASDAAFRLRPDVRRFVRRTLDPQGRVGRDASGGDGAVRDRAGISAVRTPRVARGAGRARLAPSRGAAGEDARDVARRLRGDPIRVRRRRRR